MPVYGSRKKAGASQMNSRIQDMRLAATFLRQARILCEGVQDFVVDDVERNGRLAKIGAAIGEECAHFDRLITAMKGEDEPASAGNASRIEQLNAELIECERLSHQLDELTVTLDSASSDRKTSEDVILKTNADYAEKRLLDRIETLTNCLALERPRTVRDILTFALRAMAPLQELIMAVSEDSFERKQGCIAFRLLQGIIPALEELAGTTRAELGFEEPQTEAEIIENLKNALAQKATNSSDDLS